MHSPKTKDLSLNSLASFQYEENTLRKNFPNPSQDLHKDKFLLEQKVEELKREKARMVTYLEQKDLLIKRQAVDIKTLQAEVSKLQVEMQEMTIANKQLTISQLQEQQQLYLKAQKEDDLVKQAQNTPQEMQSAQQTHFGYYHETFGDELDSPAFSQQNSQAQLHQQHSLAHFHQPPLQQHSFPPAPLEKQSQPPQQEPEPEQQKMQPPPLTPPLEEEDILQEIFSLCQQINPALPKPPKFTLQISGRP